MNNQPDSGDDLFAQFPHSPEEHFRLHFFGAVLVCMEHAVASGDSFEAVLKRFPFLTGYNNELAQLLEGVSSEVAFGRWCTALGRWEEQTQVHLPLKALRELLGISPAAAMCYLTAGLSEEDAHFGELFEHLQNTPGQRRCTLGLLRAIWRTQLDGSQFSALWRQARAFGLAQAVNPDAANPDIAVQLPPAVWETLREVSVVNNVAWAQHRPSTELFELGNLILPPDVLGTVQALPRMLAQGEVSGIVVRGSKHNGKRTVLGAIARQLGKGVLELKITEPIEDAQWRALAGMAALQNAMPIVTFDLGPGEVRTVPLNWPTNMPLGITLGQHGGIAREQNAQTITLTLKSPDVDARQLHWRRALPALPADELVHVSARYRLPAGQIHRAARLAGTRASLDNRTDVSATDIAEALRTLNRQTLDALARRCVAEGDWSRLCSSAATLRELEHLESRCRHRERLPSPLETTRSAGVRALFTGPSGTGKTHAARLLAACLQKDLYQLDLSAVVNKYIGETEKNLGRLLEAAEDLDVILLIDEGDALLTQRTEVHSSNDRYGNMETNFLLQRLESYQGILIITTNARTRIDSAFERRMDVTVEFHPPDAEERWALWQLHLPARHDVRDDFLNELAGRCELSGGQIRNATLHANLLALDNGGIIKPTYLEAAIRREYAKFGGVCPLRHVVY